MIHDAKLKLVAQDCRYKNSAATTSGHLSEFNNHSAHPQHPHTHTQTHTHKHTTHTLY